MTEPDGAGRSVAPEAGAPGRAQPDRPLLLVDIDGVISLFGFDPLRRPAGNFLAVEGIMHFLSGRAGEHLRRLAEQFELAWCSGWEERANEHLPHALALAGPLPHVAFDARPEVQAHWKLSGIDTFAGPARPVAWIDDAHDDATREWAAARPGPTLLVHTEPAVGLTDAHVEELVAWADQVSAVSGTSGTSGARGTSGASGTSGTSGTSGASGAAGTSEAR